MKPGETRQAVVTAVAEDVEVELAAGLRATVRSCVPRGNFCLLHLIGIFWPARSPLYHNEILQENMRSKAFFKLYKMCTLLHRFDLKKVAKNQFEKSAIFVKIQQI